MTNTWIVGLLLLSLVTTSCFTPIPTAEDESDCELWSRKWELDVSGQDGGLLVADLSQSLGYCGKPECALYGLLAIAAIPITSLVVSGSIVVMGNTVHWVEEQGTCDDSFTQEAVESLTESTKSAGGMVIRSSQEFLRWIQSHVETSPDE